MESISPKNYWFMLLIISLKSNLILILFKYTFKFHNKISVLEIYTLKMDFDLLGWIADGNKRTLKMKKRVSHIDKFKIFVKIHIFN